MSFSAGIVASATKPSRKPRASPMRSTAKAPSRNSSRSSGRPPKLVPMPGSSVRCRSRGVCATVRFNHLYNVRMSRIVLPLTLGLITASASLAFAQQPLANASFQMQYDASGIHSLRRTNDTQDTDYIAANGTLGRLLIRYRTTKSGDWRELREMQLQSGASAQSISYAFGVWQPTLAARSTGGAAVGAAGVRALNDGLVPVVAAGGGRGGGAGGRAAGTRRRSSRRADVHMGGIARRDPVGAIHVSRRGNGREDRSVLDSAATVVAVAVSGRIAVERSLGARIVRRRAKCVYCRRIRASQDDGHARGSDDGAGGERRTRGVARRHRSRHLRRHRICRRRRRSSSTASHSSGT